MAKRDKSSSPRRFHVGDKVRVRHGVQDPDFPDMPLGGWVATIEEAWSEKNKGFYLVAWSRETLAALHPVYRKRCERDGLDYEHYQLTDDDLEPYAGEPLAIEQPTDIKTPALSPDNQDDRIRIILGLTGDDPLPNVDEETLMRYGDYLTKHLSFPFDAHHCPEDEPRSNVTVVGLADPDEFECDEFYGLFCKAGLGRRHIIVPLGEIEFRKRAPNHQLIDDYLYWFWNWR